MAKVTCIKSVSIGSLGLAFVEGKEYDIPSKEANAYTEYFKKHAVAKKKTTEENKEATTEDNK